MRPACLPPLMVFQASDMRCSFFMRGVACCLLPFARRCACPPTNRCVPGSTPRAAQFTRAVEMKQVAEQDAERAKFVVMKAEQVCTTSRWDAAAARAPCCLHMQQHM